MTPPLKPPPWSEEEQLAAYAELATRRVCSRCKGQKRFGPPHVRQTFAGESVMVECSRCGGDGVEPLPPDPSQCDSTMHGVRCSLSRDHGEMHRAAVILPSGTTGLVRWNTYLADHAEAPTVPQGRSVLPPFVGPSRRRK